MASSCFSCAPAGSLPLSLFCASRTRPMHLRHRGLKLAHPRVVIELLLEIRGGQPFRGQPRIDEQRERLRERLVRPPSAAPGSRRAAPADPIGAARSRRTGSRPCVFVTRDGGAPPPPRAGAPGHHVGIVRVAAATTGATPAAASPAPAAGRRGGAAFAAVACSRPRPVASRISIVDRAGRLGRQEVFDHRAKHVRVHARAIAVARPVHDTASAVVTCALTWCSELRLSRIQIARPCVETTRSFRWTLMSVIGTFGRFSWNDCQCAPLSNEMNMPNSVPA